MAVLAQSGTQTLDVVSQHPDQFKVVALVAHHNIDLLEKQIKEYQPLVAGLVDESAFKELQGRYIEVLQNLWAVRKHS